MPRSAFLAFLAAFCALIPPAPAIAGAFLLPEGQGQFIAGVGYSEGSRRFDPSGHVVAAAPVDKLEASGYLEYAPLGSKRTKLVLNGGDHAFAHLA